MSALDDFKNLAGVLWEIVLLPFRKRPPGVDPDTEAARVAERERRAREYQEKLARWLERAMTLHAAGGLEQFDAELRAEAAGMDEEQFLRNHCDFHEQLARKLFDAGDLPAAQRYGDLVLRHYDEERMRESCGAGGGYALMESNKAVERLRYLWKQG